MKNKNLEIVLRNWFEEMTNRYKWLIIKFEYNEKRGVYLISYEPTRKIKKSPCFIKESMDFEDKLSDVYGDEAPLFCDDEKYFKISTEAEVIQYRNYDFINVDLVKQQPQQHRWKLPQDSNNDKEIYSDYVLAA